MLRTHKYAQLCVTTRYVASCEWWKYVPTWPTITHSPITTHHVASGSRKLRISMSLTLLFCNNPLKKKVSSGNQLPSSGHCSPASSSISNPVIYKSLFSRWKCNHSSNYIYGILWMLSFLDYYCKYFKNLVTDETLGGLGFVQFIWGLLLWWDDLIV